MFRELAFEIFMADGGVDDYELMSDEELIAIVRAYLNNFCTDPVMLDAVVRAARAMAKEVDDAAC